MASNFATEKAWQVDDPSGDLPINDEATSIVRLLRLARFNRNRNGEFQRQQRVQRPWWVHEVRVVLIPWNGTIFGTTPLKVLVCLTIHPPPKKKTSGAAEYILATQEIATFSECVDCCGCIRSCASRKNLRDLAGCDIAVAFCWFWGDGLREPKT